KRLADLADGLGSDEPVYFDRGKTIVQEGQTGLRMYAVMEGRVAVSILRSEAPRRPGRRPGQRRTGLFRPRQDHRAGRSDRAAHVRGHGRTRRGVDPQIGSASPTWPTAWAATNRSISTAARPSCRKVRPGCACTRSWKDASRCRSSDRKRLADLADGLGSDEPVYFDRGKTIVQEGQTGLRMYAVMEGRVAVSILGGGVVER